MPGIMPRMFSSGPSFRIILNWARKSLKSKEAVRSFLLHPRGFLFVDGLGGFLHQADDVAHPENPARQTIGHERLELIELFADAGELDRALRHFAHRERCAAARVAIEFRQDDAGDAERFVEMRRHADRLLAGRRIGHEQHFLRLEEFLELLDFLDQRGVDFLPAGGVENLDVTGLLRRPFETRSRRRASHPFPAATGV